MKTTYIADKKRVAAWVASRIRDMGNAPSHNFEAIGIERSGQLIGGVVYTDYREIGPDQHDIIMHCAGEPGWLSRQSLREFFGYPFNQLKCIRVTATVAKGNKRARSMNERLGFRVEGCIKSGYGSGKDGIILGMLRQECKWIVKGI